MRENEYRDKISVIVTSYNCRNEIARCIESIERQTYKNLEIIVIDDGSTDGTERVINKLFGKDPRVRFIQKKNGGVSSARNLGLKYASGEYITFVDGDDSLEKDMYEVLYTAIHYYNAEIAHCSYNRIQDNKKKPIISDGKVHVQNRNEALRCLIGGYLFVGSSCNKLYKKNLLEDITFDTDIIINEDVKMNFEVFRKSNSIVFLDFPKYNYHIRQSSATNTVKDMRKINDGLKVSKYIFEECKDSKELKSVAAERYMYSLICAYRMLLNISTDKISKNQYKNEIVNLYKSTPFKNRRIRWNVYGIWYLPCLYKMIYKLYDKIRTPNWDVRKE